MALCTILSILFTAKMSNYFFPERMNAVYIKVGIYGLQAYVFLYNWFQKVSTFKNYILSKFSLYKKRDNYFTFIKNGIEVRECDLSQFYLYMSSLDYYDVILYRELEGECYNVLRVDKYNFINGSEKDISKSNVKFLDIKIEYNNNSYSIDFSKDNYYIDGNMLLDKYFVKWYLNHAYGILVKDDEEYVCNIMDQNIDLIQLNKDKHVIIRKDNYIIGEIHHNIDELSHTSED